MLSQTVQHPVLDFANRRRISRTAVVTAHQFDSSDGLALSAALKKIRDLVDKKTTGLEVGAAFYYVTFEVIVDDGDTGPGRPMRPSAAGQANSVVLPRLSERVAA